MVENKPGGFEQKVSEIESILAQLEKGEVELDRAVDLFKRGKQLVNECEVLLKGAQDQIDRAMEQSAASAAESNAQISP